jgi:hypothetical protein
MSRGILDTSVLIAEGIDPIPRELAISVIFRGLPDVGADT